MADDEQIIRRVAWMENDQWNEVACVCPGDEHEPWCPVLAYENNR